MKINHSHDKTDDITDDEIIMDIQRVARALNTSTLSEEEYRISGGKYSEKIDRDRDDCGSFGNYCALAGIKNK
jgi:hypothetical protein